MPRKSDLVKPLMHIILSCLQDINGFILNHILHVSDIQMLGRNHLKRKQCPEMTIAVDWEVKQQIKQKTIIDFFSFSSFFTSRYTKAKNQKPFLQILSKGVSRQLKID